MGRNVQPGGSGWRGALEPDARRLVEAYEREVGALPEGVASRLPAGPVSRARLEAALAEHASPQAVARARASVDLGTPSLGHGGAGLVSQIAGLRAEPPPAREADKGLLARLFGTANDRALARLEGTVEAVKAAGAKLAGLSDAALRSKADDFRARLAQGASLDDLLPEAFATAREVSRRVLDLTHYDEQVMGGALLHQGKIAEMATGEGKTLAATLPVYLNALSGEGVHVVTANDYLAKRDAQWMGPVYHALGLTVGVLQADGSAFVFDPSYHCEDPRCANLRPVPRKEAYAADITHGTNHEFGFDYLRDNIAGAAKDLVQRAPAFAIVDEVDNVLIDEARTPMIISGPSPHDPSEACARADAVVRQLALAVKVAGGGGELFELEAEHPGDYIVDEKARNVTLTESGLSRVEAALGVENLYDDPGLANRVHKALDAHALYERDKDYIVEDGKVVIVDPNTGRPSPGRRWADGLHQAIEAKEGVAVNRENETLARISVQNYFRRYEKLAGMTGTAATDAEELMRTFGTEVVTIPTHRPIARVSEPDQIYISRAAKDAAILADIERTHARGQPVLVGTTSVEESEALAAQLVERGIPHRVLNAKAHEAEAEVVAQAGRSGAVTIATNMAGRGTDIKLGGDAAALAAARVAAGEAYAAALVRAERETKADKARVLGLGGLRVIGTTRHDSRRIDDQLLGRAGRQGDPGASVFYLSLEDDLMRRFGTDTLALVQRVWGEHHADDPIDSPRLTKAVRRAQARVEGHHADTRRRLLEYDDVLEVQRDTMYGDRRLALEYEPKDLEDTAHGLIEEVSERLVEHYGQATEPAERAEDLAKGAEEVLGVRIELGQYAEREGEALTQAVTDGLTRVFERAQVRLGPVGPELVRQSLLRAMDEHWRAHLVEMDLLKQGIHWRGMAQRDPLTEYKREAFEMFQGLQDRVRADAVRNLIGAGV